MRETIDVIERKTPVVVNEPLLKNFNFITKVKLILKENAISQYFEVRGGRLEIMMILLFKCSLTTVITRGY